VTSVISPQRSQPVVERMVLQNIAWDIFQALIQDLAAQPGKRLTYDNGVLEI